MNFASNITQPKNQINTAN